MLVTFFVCFFCFFFWSVVVWKKCVRSFVSVVSWNVEDFFFSSQYVGGSCCHVLCGEVNRFGSCMAFSFSFFLMACGRLIGYLSFRWHTRDFPLPLSSWWWSGFSMIYSWCWLTFFWYLSPKTPKITRLKDPSFFFFSMYPLIWNALTNLVQNVEFYLSVFFFGTRVF